MTLIIERYLAGRIAADYGVAPDKKHFLTRLLRGESKEYLDKNLDFLMESLERSYAYMRSRGGGDGGVQRRKTFPAKVVEMPDQFEPAPTYAYPVDQESIATDFGRAYEVVRDWEGRLRLLCESGSKAAELSAANIQSFVQWLCAQCDSNGRWQVLGDERYSNDEVTEFIKKPTATALAILVFVKREYPDVASQIPELGPLIQAVSKQIFETSGFRGHGYDTWSDMAVLLATLAAGGVVSEWFRSPHIYPGLKARLVGLRDDMISAPQNWCCYSEIGFSFITIDELNRCIRCLDPFQELGPALK